MLKYKLQKIISQADEIIIPTVAFLSILGFRNPEQVLLGISIMVISGSKWSLVFKNKIQEIPILLLMFILGYYTNVTIIALSGFGIIMIVKLFLQKDLSKLILLSPSLLVLGLRDKRIIMATLVINLIWMFKNRYEFNKFKS